MIGLDLRRELSQALVALQDCRHTCCHNFAAEPTDGASRLHLSHSVGQGWEGNSAVGGRRTYSGVQKVRNSRGAKCTVPVGRGGEGRGERSAVFLSRASCGPQRTKDMSPHGGIMENEYKA